MSRTKQIPVGTRFGKLTVVKAAPAIIRKYGRRTRRVSASVFVCDCGREIICAKVDAARRLSLINTTHGGTHTRLYDLWRNMRERCNNPRKQFHAWQGRGIRVCEEWNDFGTFREWSLQNGYADNLSLDRIDNDKGYCPENCRWVTWAEQLKNRGSESRLRQLTAFGKTQSFRKWQEESSISAENIRNRIAIGWTPEDAVRIAVGSKEALDRRWSGRKEEAK